MPARFAALEAQADVIGPRGSESVDLLLPVLRAWRTAYGQRSA